MSQERRSTRTNHDVYLDFWHRREALSRYLGRRAQWVSLIDIDCCEYCHLCYEPVALVETKDIRAKSKAGTVTAKLASRAMLPAWVVEYSLTPAGDDIEWFRLTQWHPQRPGTQQLTAQQYALWLWDLRREHWLRECRNGAAPRMAAAVEEAV